MGYINLFILRLIYIRYISFKNISNTYKNKKINNYSTAFLNSSTLSIFSQENSFLPKCP